MKIEDGRGKARLAGVNATQRLDVSAKTQERIMFASRDFGLSYTAVYDGVTGAADDFVAYLKNTSSTRNMFISDIELESFEAVKWKVFAVTGVATSGESVTPSSLNRSKSIAPEATAMAGDTAITLLTTGDHLASVRTPALGQSHLDFHDALILGPGDAIALKYNSGTGGICSSTIFFHFEDLN